MKKMAVVVLAFAMVMLAAAVAPAVSAKTLKCDQTIYFNVYGVPGPHPDHLGETAYWKGTITGALTGTSYYWETAKNYVVGKVEHFFEDFYIDLGDGWVSGYDNGVWNFATFKFRSTGRITDASANYAYMIGCKFHEEGITTDPGPDFTELPIIGTGTCFIGPQPIQ